MAMVLQPNKPVIVIGGSNVDICGQPFIELVPHDSNPGQIHISAGGVGRNIAHNLALCGVPVSLITAFGEDSNATFLRKVCMDAGIDISDAQTISGIPTSSYVFLNDEDGDMAAAVNDMRIFEQISVDQIDRLMPQINAGSVCVADTNIPAVLDHLAKHLRIPLIIDAVSAAKAERLRGVLQYIHTLKPNIEEAEILSGFSCRTHEEINRCADWFFQQGLHQLFLTLGKNGVFAANRKGERYCLPCLPSHVYSETQGRCMTGAGDAFLAAVVSGMLEGLSLIETAYNGLAAATICIESEDTVNPMMSRNAIAARVKEGKETVWKQI